jgi:hypothetical protein
LRRGCHAAGSANGASDKAARESASATTGEASDRGTGARADERTAGCPLAGVIRVGTGGDRKCDTDRQGTWCNKPFHGEMSSFLQRYTSYGT